MAAALEQAEEVVDGWVQDVKGAWIANGGGDEKRIFTVFARPTEREALHAVKKRKFSPRTVGEEGLGATYRKRIIFDGNP